MFDEQQLNQAVAAGMAFPRDINKDDKLYEIMNMASHELINLEASHCQGLGGNVDVKEIQREVMLNFDPETAETLLYQDYENPNTIGELECVFKGLMYANDVSVGNYHKLRLLNALTIPKRIGEESAEGYAMRTKFHKQYGGVGSSTDDKYKIPRPFDDPDSSMKANMISNFSVIVKSPRKTTSTLIREYIIGSNICNKLRQVIPNFMMTFGYYYCSMSNIDFDKNDWGMCVSGANPIGHLVLEDVRPATSFESAIASGMSGTTWLNIYLQTLLALHYANEEYDFTHGDLHTGNVMVRQGNLKISYPYKGSWFTLETDGVATLIDYGQAHGIVSVNGRNNAMDLLAAEASNIQENDPIPVIGDRGDGYDISLGMVGLEFTGNEWHKCFPLFDAYKLLMFSAQKAYLAQNFDAFDTMTKVFKFFNTTDDLATVVNWYLTNRDIYTLPDITYGGHYLSEYSLESLIEYIFAEIPNGFGRYSHTREVMPPPNNSWTMMDQESRFTALNLLHEILISNGVNESFAWPLNSTDLLAEVRRNIGNKILLPSPEDIDYAIYDGVLRLGISISKSHEGLRDFNNSITTAYGMNIKSHMIDPYTKAVSEFNRAVIFINAMEVIMEYSTGVGIKTSKNLQPKLTESRRLLETLHHGIQQAKIIFDNKAANVQNIPEISKIMKEVVRWELFDPSRKPAA